MNESGSADRPFVHLHMHSHYSLGDGVASVEALVRQVAALDMSACALTDHNSLGGVVTFLEMCEANSVQPIVGCQLDVLPHTGVALGAEIGSLILLVESEIGYRNLAQLISCAQSKRCEGQVPHVTQQELAERSAGLIALVGPASPVRQLLSPPDPPKVEEYLTELVRAFGRENLFFELQPGVSNELRFFNDCFIQLSEFLRIGVVATNDAHYVWPEDELVAMFLRRHRPPHWLTDKGVELGEHRRHLASSREMRDRFAFLPHAIANTQLIAERCRFRPQLRKRRLLVHEYARGFDAESFLWDLVFHCATERYGLLDERVKSRLNEEFDYLNRHNLANYFLLLWKLASFLNEQKIPCLVRRGAITTSLIAYVLGLTGIDPLAHHLALEPLVEGNAAFPDVTVHLSSGYLENLIGYLKGSYGNERVARIGHYQYWPRQVLLKEICRWAGLPDQKADALITSDAIATRGDKAARWADLFGGGVNELSPAHPASVGFIFHRLHPLPRAFVADENRLVLGGENIGQVVPLSYPDGHTATTQLDAADCDALGLPRIGLAASRPLRILDEAIGFVRHERNRQFDLLHVEDSDAETYRLFAQGRTAGIPGFEGIGIRALLQRDRPTNLDQLIRLKMTCLGGQDSADRSPPGTTIADCRLAYRCAYVKAHYPVSYYTALLTSVCRHRRSLQQLLREIAQESIRLLPVDINVSKYEFAQVSDRTVGTGLVVVRGMGKSTAEHIEKVRRSGAFENLVDFCRRTERRHVSHRLIENLIKAGALDSCGWRRSQMLAMLDRVAGQARLQAGSPTGAVQMEFEFSPLDGVSAEEDLEPPDREELSLNLRLQYEFQAAGHAISDDPLAPFVELLAQCRIFRAPAALSQRMVGRDIYLAGMVNQIEKGGLPGMEEPVIWLDFDGVFIAVPETLSQGFNRELRGSEPLMIGGTVICHDNIVCLRAHTIALLMKIHHQIRQAQQLVLDLQGENKHTVRVLGKICAAFPGQTAVAVVHHEAAGRFALRRLTLSRVTVCPPLLNSLRQVLQADKVRVVGYGDD